MGRGIDWTGVVRKAVPRGGGGRKGKSSGGMREPILPANRIVAIGMAVFAFVLYLVHPILGIIACVACARRLADNTEAPQRPVDSAQREHARQVLARLEPFPDPNK